MNYEWNYLQKSPFCKNMPLKSIFLYFCGSIYLQYNCSISVGKQHPTFTLIQLSKKEDMYDLWGQEIVGIYWNMRYSNFGSGKALFTLGHWNSRLPKGIAYSPSLEIFQGMTGSSQEQLSLIIWLTLLWADVWTRWTANIPSKQGFSMF